MGSDMDLSKLGRDNLLVGAGGILLIVDLLFLPWLHSSVALLGAQISFSVRATAAPGALWGVLALLLTIAVVVDLALDEFRPQTRVPTTQLGRAMTRCAVAALVVFFLLMKYFAETSFLGVGAYLGFLLAIVVVVGAYRHGQGADG
jgi:Na+-translocating ferredoxin:NAD+ oxidoreductase RnfA subunit